jgi:hypothetical protein
MSFTTLHFSMAFNVQLPNTQIKTLPYFRLSLSKHHSIVTKDNQVHTSVSIPFVKFSATKRFLEWRFSADTQTQMRSNTVLSTPCFVSESCTAEHYFTVLWIMTQKEFMASIVMAFFHNLFHCELLMRFWVKSSSNDPHLHFFRAHLVVPIKRSM